MKLAASLAAAAAGLALAGGTAFGAWNGNPLTDPHEGGTSSAAQDALREEIRAMVDAGLPDDDPKVAMLEEELAALDALEDTVAVPDPGMDPEALDAAAAGSTRSTGADPTEQWDTGEVECEPVPGRLTMADIAEATCFVEQQPDGSVRYVAVAPDGTEHATVFADE